MTPDFLIPASRGHPAHNSYYQLVEIQHLIRSLLSISSHEPHSKSLQFAICILKNKIETRLKNTQDLPRFAQ
jgi:hypothetical protein